MNVQPTGRRVLFSYLSMHVSLPQVLMNLVCTSLKFTHTGDIKVSATATQNIVQVVVADTGQGLSPDQLHKALNPFEHVGWV